MFDFFDSGKILIIGIVALVVIGPKDLPRVLRQVGQVYGKLRKMAGEFQGQFMQAMRDSEIDDLRKDVTSMVDQAKVDLPDFNPVQTMKNEISGAIDTKPGEPVDAAAVPSTAVDVPAPATGLPPHDVVAAIEQPAAAVPGPAAPPPPQMQPPVALPNAGEPIPADIDEEPWRARKYSGG